MRRGITRVDAIVVLLVVLLATLLLGAAAFSVASPRARSHTVQCGNNLRQIALASMCYCDDKKAYPHLGAPEQLDGGYRSNTAARVFRTILNTGYAEGADTFVCPASPDESAVLPDESRNNAQRFRWGGASGPATLSALGADQADEHDRALDGSTEISYGYTRQFLTASSPGRSLLAGDKSMAPRRDASEAARRAHTGNMSGNHPDFMLAGCVDGRTVKLVPSPPFSSSHMDTLLVSQTATEHDGFLGVLGDDPESGQ